MNPISSVESTLEAARQASFRGLHQQAVDLCVSVLRQKPGEPRALAFLGLCLWRAKAFIQAVDVLRNALERFPAQMELSLALLESLQALGREDDALRFAATLPDALLAQAPLGAAIQALHERMVSTGPGADVEHRLMLAHNDGEFAQVSQELEQLLERYPNWGVGRMLLASLMFNRGGLGIPANALQVPPDCDAAGIQTMWRARLAQAMSSHRAAILAHLDVALAASPNDPRALLIRARTRFECGLKLDPAELGFVSEQSGCQLLGPFPLRPALDEHLRSSATVTLLQPATLTMVPAPRYVGARFELDSAIGPVLSSDRYVGEAPGAMVAAGSEVTLLSSGLALCEPLTHALGELTHYLSDRWIALGSVQQLVLRKWPVIVVNGTAISLLGAAARFYGHWLLDYLMRLRSVYQHPGAARACVLVEEDMPASHYEALQLVYGTETDIRRVPRGHVVQVERLYFPAQRCSFPTYLVWGRRRALRSRQHRPRAWLSCVIACSRRSATPSGAAAAFS